VGNYTIDQTYWGRPEDIPQAQGGYPTRPAFTAPASHASDVGGAVVAALASSSLVFADADPGYATTLLAAAFDLYAVVTDSANFGLCAARLRGPLLRPRAHMLGAHAGVRRPTKRRADAGEAGARARRYGDAASFRACVGPFARGSTGAQCVPASVQLNGSAVPLYNGSTYYDCLLWAATWMYRATGDGGYLDDVSTFYVAHLYDETGSEVRAHQPQPYT
jgi:endoglucanase